MCMHLPTQHQNTWGNKLIEIQGEIVEGIVVVGDFNISLWEMDRSRGQKSSQNIVELKSPINQLDKINIWRQFQPTIAEYKLFSRSQGVLTKTMFWIIKHTLKFLKKRNHTVYALYEYKGSKREVNNRNIAGKAPNTYRLNNTLSKNTWIKEEISSNVKNILK